MTLQIISHDGLRHFEHHFACVLRINCG